MAMSYPEGEVFFDRGVLRTASKDFAYDANDPKAFYSYMMVEYLWNVEMYHGQKECRWDFSHWLYETQRKHSGYTHPRSTMSIVKGSGWGTHYGNWDYIPFSYGPEPNDIKKRVVHNLCKSGNRFVSHERGDAAEPWFMLIPMPTREEKYIWIDLLAHVRAVYFPVAQVASKDYPHLSTWVQVNFAIDRTLKVPYYNDKGYSDKAVADFKTEKLKGLGASYTCCAYTMALDVARLIELLSIPRQFRNTDPYEAKLILFLRLQDLQTVPISKHYNDRDDFSWLDIQKAHSGLDLMWKKAEKGSWLEAFLKNFMVFAIGLVPGAGPLMSIAFSLTWTAISDPDAFYDELTLWCPNIKLTELFKKDMDKSLGDMRKFIDPKWTKRNNAKPSVGKLNAKVTPVQKTSLSKARAALGAAEMPEWFDPDEKDTGSEEIISDPPEATPVLATPLVAA